LLVGLSFQFLDLPWRQVMANSSDRGIYFTLVTRATHKITRATA